MKLFLEIREYYSISEGKI